MFNVAIVASSVEQCANLRARIVRTGMGGAIDEISFGDGSNDSSCRRIYDSKPDVVLIEVPPENPEPGLRLIRQFHSEVKEIAVFAVGELSQPKVIVSSMQAGACEYIERNGDSSSLEEAFGRLEASRKSAKSAASRGKLIAIINAKGGCGATTVAVNTAIALHAAYGSVALVDLAPLGSLAVHLNVRTNFGVGEALRNLHRLDASLLEGLVTESEYGPHLLAGSSEPTQLLADSEGFARLFDVLVSQYEFVVLDLSTRFDDVAKIITDLADSVVLVSQAELVSLWSAAKIRECMSTGTNKDKFKVVLNRHRKSLAHSSAELESSLGCKVSWKIPNQYHAVAASIERGEPLSHGANSEIAKAFTGLATLISGNRNVVQQMPARGEESKQNIFSRLINFRTYSGSVAPQIEKP